MATTSNAAGRDEAVLECHRICERLY